jgi:hypothetical protein
MTKKEHTCKKYGMLKPKIEESDILFSEKKDKVALKVIQPF